MMFLCLPIYAYRRPRTPYSYSLTRLSLIIGLIIRTILILISWTLVIFLKLQQRTNFSRSTAIYMNRSTELLWAPLLVLCLPLLLCSIEETLQREGKMPTYYKRFVDDILTMTLIKASADNFLGILNQYHSSVKFSMEMESNSMLPFLGT